mmetsp:Transcript_15738/g.42714  ORF Transcript_15738/g.42714 Transcript_15738/m.42714 type:complete len:233 (-) Transcript_15738:987-1685(-)
MQPSSTSSGSVTGTCHNSSSPDKHWSGTRGLGWWHATPQGSASKDDARTNREPHTPSTPPQAASTRSPRHTHPLVDSSSPESAPTGPPTQAASPSHSQPTHHAPADSVRTAAHNPSALHSYTDPASVGMQHVLPAEPGGPGAEQLPHTPMQAVSQSLDDLADALQEQQQQRRQQLLCWSMLPMWWLAMCWASATRSSPWRWRGQVVPPPPSRLPACTNYHHHGAHCLQHSWA